MEGDDSASNISTLLLGIVGFLLYWFFLRPTPPPAQGVATEGGGTGTGAAGGASRTLGRNGGTRAALTPRGGGGAAAVGGGVGGWNAMPRLATPRTAPLSEAAAEVLGQCQRKPSHVNSSQEIVGLGGINVLTESGLVAFAHTAASSSSSSSSQAAATTSNTSSNSNSSSTFGEDVATIRQERAKILSKLCGFAKTSITPPSKGATLVMAVSQADLGPSSSSLGKILHSLATFYNVLVIVHIAACASESEVPKKSELVKQLRGKELSEAVLPNHRILLATTVTGRVALVRQLSKVALVVDWDEEVESQLTRFGYQVVLVPNWSKLLD